MSREVGVKRREQPVRKDFIFGREGSKFKKGNKYFAPDLRKRTKSSGEWKRSK